MTRLHLARYFGYSRVLAGFTQCIGKIKINLQMSIKCLQCLLSSFDDTFLTISIMSAYIYHTLSKGEDGECYCDEFITSACLDFILIKGTVLPNDGVFPVRIVYEITERNANNYPVKNPADLKKSLKKIRVLSA